jgi:tRNA(adenine34) deaminase
VFTIPILAFTMPIQAFTMDRSRCSRSADLGVHDGPTRADVKTVTTTSATIPPGLFTRDAATIARTLALPRVSPNGPVSGLRMLSFFINRAGRQLPRLRRAELEKAKRLMQRKITAEKGRS